jgi:alcohol dehydrogenase
VKAAVLKAFGAPLVVETLADPAAGSGDVVVEVAASRVLAYMGEVFSGKRPYPLELPIVPGPGAIGRIRSVGPDATRLAAGDWVYVDPTVRARDTAVSPDIILQGLIAPGEMVRNLHRYYHDGSWAQLMRVPTENVTAIGTIDAVDAPRWSAIGILLVPFGGLLTIDVAAGETVLINGATGAFGSAGVAVALAMGARAVIATGRNEAILQELVRRFGPRVHIVKFTGNENDDRAAMMKFGSIDCVLDILPPQADPTWARAAIMAVRPHGRVALMGGIGGQGSGGLELPYAWLMRNGITIKGQWMYPREAVIRMIGLIRSGLVNLSHYNVTSFDLDHVNEAVLHAAQHADPFDKTVICP